jgi:hypothetical protein
MDSNTLADLYDRGLEQETADDLTLTEAERAYILDSYRLARTFAPVDPAVWERAEALLRDLDALWAEFEGGTIDPATYRRRGAALPGISSLETHLATLNLLRTRAIALWTVTSRRAQSK